MAFAVTKPPSRDQLAAALTLGPASFFSPLAMSTSSFPSWDGSRGRLGASLVGLIAPLRMKAVLKAIPDCTENADQKQGIDDLAHNLPAVIFGGNPNLLSTKFRTRAFPTAVEPLVITNPLVMQVSRRCREIGDVTLLIPRQVEL